MAGLGGGGDRPAARVIGPVNAVSPLPKVTVTGPAEVCTTRPAPCESPGRPQHTEQRLPPRQRGAIIPRGKPGGVDEGEDGSAGRAERLSPRPRPRATAQAAASRRGKGAASGAVALSRCRRRPLGRRPFRFPSCTSPVRIRSPL